MISEFQRMGRLLARQKNQGLTCLDKLAMTYQYFINIMSYYPDKTVHQLGMLTYLQLSDCLRTSGKIRLNYELLEIKDSDYKSIIDRIII